MKKKKQAPARAKAEGIRVRNATGPDPQGQKGARATANITRQQVSGLTNRTRGHVSARGKRAQKRRDSR